jgi:hypothetical protein
MNSGKAISSLLSYAWNAMELGSVPHNTEAECKHVEITVVVQKFLFGFIVTESYLWNCLS